MREVYEGWQRGPHHALAVCNDCHTPAGLVAKYWVKSSNGWHHSKAFTLQNWHEPIRIRASNARVLQDNCLRCHAEFLLGIAPHGRVAGDDVNCVRCHRGAGHGPAR
jgi:cytochrome c nitrite reductase small subunit